MGVRITPPSPGELATMVFGDRLHPRLLEFLLRERPALDVSAYAERAAELQARVFERLGLYAGSQLAGAAEQLRVVSQSYLCDPRSLFDSDKDFYALLE